MFKEEYSTVLEKLFYLLRQKNGHWEDFYSGGYLVYRMSRIKEYIGKFSYLGFWASNASSLPKILQFLIATY